MQLKQLLFLREIVDRKFSVSEAAAALHTSQPSVSRQVQALEDELGVTVFVRGKKRFLGLTKPGVEIIRIARRVLRDTDSLRTVGREYGAHEGGSLTISTSHTQARYVLPRVIQAFAEQHPSVNVTLRVGTPAQTVEWVHDGEADLSISAESARVPSDVVLLPCYDQHKIVVVPRGHPLLSVSPLTLEALSEYPLITYDRQYLTSSVIARAFEARNLKPKIVLSATDVDVMKTYVKSGLGVAIVVELAYDKAEDETLCAIDARHLFSPSRISIGVARNSYLRSYVFDFIRLFSPALTRAVVERAISEADE
ncbi:MAG TPA: LysR substrate-binding domain-containing protein [Burkholderiales bacterium]|nr:LysR substrate-binding domain-containing protein [Burkholderiales bacterium]